MQPRLKDGWVSAGSDVVKCGRDARGPGVGLHMHTVDYIVIAIYMLGIVGLGCWVGLRQRKGDEASKSYFLAGGTLTWPIIGLALFSTNISTIHLVALAQAGYDSGLLMGNFELMAGFTLILLALFFAPFYVRSQVATLPDFLEKRYSRASRDWLAIVSIISAILIHISFTLGTAAIVVNGLLGIDKEFAVYTIVVIAGLTCLYTAVGGLMAVVTTEAIQTIVLLVGAFIVAVIAYFQCGGWGGIQETLAANGQLAKLSMLQSEGGLPWYSVLLGYPIIGIWYWCTDQTIVQRVLGAKSENHARVGALFAGFIKILPVFILVLPGLMCYVLVQQGTFGGDGPGNSEDTFAFLIQNVLPIGLRGVVAAALLAAAMSTVSGALNSIATLFSYDLYKRWRPATTEKGLVLLGRVVTVVAVVLAIAWSTYIVKDPTFKSIFKEVAALICYVAPPITATFLLGIFWKGASRRGSIVTLVLGFLLGVVAFFTDMSGRTGGDALVHALKGDAVPAVVKVDAKMAPATVRLGVATPEDLVSGSDFVFSREQNEIRLTPEGVRKAGTGELRIAYVCLHQRPGEGAATPKPYAVTVHPAPSVWTVDPVVAPKIDAGSLKLAIAPVFVKGVDFTCSREEGEFRLTPEGTQKAGTAELRLSYKRYVSSLLPWHDFGMRTLGNGAFAAAIVEFNFMIAAFVLCILCMILHIVISLFTPDELTEEKAALVWKSPLDTLRGEAWPGLGNYKLLALLLFVFLVVTYYVLR